VWESLNGFLLSLFGNARMMTVMVMTTQLANTKRHLINVLNFVVIKVLLVGVGGF
jgi:hypothetical protein